MEIPRINWEINIGTVFHVLILIGGLAVGYGSMMNNYETHLKIIQDMQQQTTRIEKYLSSKDPNYWKDSKDY
jgi:hypothetical protein